MGTDAGFLCFYHSRGIMGRVVFRFKMAQSLSAEEFGRIQDQIIELRTSNYEFEATSQRLQSELTQLQEKLTAQEKELQKANKIINKSKNKKEYAILLEENENFQRQFQAQEENFKLQNQTLLEEINKLNEDNTALQKEKEKLLSGGAQESGGSGVEIRRLRAESAALQKSLANAQVKHQQELTVLHYQLQSSSSEQSDSSLAQPTGDQSLVNNNDVSVDDEIPQQKDSVPVDNESTSRLREVLNDELTVFRESINASIQNDRSQVGEIKLEGGQDSQSASEEAPVDVQDAAPAIQVEPASTENMQDVNSETQGYNKYCVKLAINKQVQSLKERLEGALEPLMSSSVDALQVNGSGKSTNELLQQAETRNTSLEKEIKEMSALQLRLDTELEEKHLLQEQLQQGEESSKKEVTQLRAELAKLTDKIKKKQESYLQLQEEKEKLYSVNKKAMEDMKSKKENEIRILAEQMTKLQEEMGTTNQRYFELQEDSSEAIKDLQNSLVHYQSQASSSAEVTEQVVTQLRQEKEAITNEVGELKQKLLMNAQETEETVDLISKLERRLQESETHAAELTLEVEELREQFKEQRAAVDCWNEQIQQLTEEKDKLSASFEEVSKLAEKRKGTLDHMAIERQQVGTAHREQTENLQDEHKKTITDLKEQLTGEKKLRKEVDELQQKLNDIKTKLQSSESKCGWFERRLGESEESLTAEKEQNEKAVSELREKHEQDVATANEERDSQAEELHSQIESLNTEIQNQSVEMERLTQEVRDKEVESRIAGKKGDQLVKDLKRQFKLERKRADQLQQRLQEALSENRAKQNFDDIFNTPGSIPRRNSGDSSTLSPNRSELDSPDLRPPSPSSSLTGLLNEDTTELIERLADVQQEKWLLEEKVRHLEETGGAFAEDLLRKSEVIQAYAMETKIGPICGSPKPDAITALKEKMKVNLHFGKTKTETKKFQLILEETLTKNVQLQKDVDRLSNELVKYKRRADGFSEESRNNKTTAVNTGTTTTDGLLGNNES